MQIARRSRAIALQSVYAGIGLSFLGMVVAAFGYLTPVRGALIQEVIDVAVILNALRALSGGTGGGDGLAPTPAVEPTRLPVTTARTVPALAATVTAGSPDVGDQKH